MIAMTPRWLELNVVGYRTTLTSSSIGRCPVAITKWAGRDQGFFHGPFPRTTPPGYHHLNVKFANDISLRLGLGLQSELGLEIGLASLTRVKESVQREKCPNGRMKLCDDSVDCKSWAGLRCTRRRRFSRDSMVHC